MQVILVIIGLAYAITFFGLWFKDFSITFLGCIFMFGTSVYIWPNGIDTMNNFLTQMFAAVTGGVAAYVGLRSSYELYKDM